MAELQKNFLHVKIISIFEFLYYSYYYCSKLFMKINSINIIYHIISRKYCKKTRCANIFSIHYIYKPSLRFLN